MECPSCLDVFNSKKRVPKNIPCGHTYCLECLEKIYEKNGIIRCPTCRFMADPKLQPN
jgi:kelch-like protein 10